MTPLLQSLIEKEFGATALLHDATLLTGGASQETWRIQVSQQTQLTSYCLRREHKGDTEASLEIGGIGLATEALLMQSAKAAGVAVPQIIRVLDPSDGLGNGFLMEWLEGETLGQKICHHSDFATIKSQLAAQCGHQLALIHAMDLGPLQTSGALKTMSARECIEQTYAQYLALDVSQPMLDYTARYLLDHTPEQHEYVLNHGDFRNGNLMIDPQLGLTAVLDWELASITDPAKDIAWLCVNSWRFGNNEFWVGGFGHLDDLLQVYNNETGREIQRAQVLYWMLFGSFWWSVCCLSMGQSYKTGVNLSLERPLIGRLASEGQLDCVNLLLPSGFEIIATETEQDLIPTDAELADALHHYLKHELVPKFEGKDKFLAQIAASTARTLARSARYRDTLQAQEERRLRALLDLSGTCHELNVLLCQQLRNRVIGLDDPRLQAHLRATVEGQVQIDQPQYLAFSQRGA